MEVPCESVKCTLNERVLVSFALSEVSLGNPK